MMGDDVLKIEIAPDGASLRYTSVNTSLPAPIYAAKLNGLWLSRGAVAQLCKDLAITPDITAEEAECAILERELRELAHEAEACYHIEENPPTWATRCMVSLQGERPGYDHSFGPTRLEALRAAVAHVRELRAAAERAKLPEPGEMDYRAVTNELGSLGAGSDWHGGLVVAWTVGRRKFFLSHDESPLDLARRALTEARRIDAAAK